MKFNTALKNDWNFSKDSTKTIRLLAVDFYDVIVDEADRNFELII